MNRKHRNSKSPSAEGRAQTETPEEHQSNSHSMVPSGFSLACVIGFGLLVVIGLVWFIKSIRAQREEARAWDAVPRAVLTAGAPASSPSDPPKTAPMLSAHASTNAAAGDSAVIEKVNRATQLLADGKPQEAIPFLQEAARLSPRDEDVHYNLGIAFARLGKNEEAVKEYEEALRIFPDYAEAQNNLGNALVRMGKREEALKHFEQAVKIMPEYASAWNNYGNALQLMGQTNQALEYFQKAVAADTNYWEAHFNLGTSYLKQKQFPRAQSEFGTVLRLQPDFRPAAEAMARIEKQSGTPPAAK